MFSKTAEYALRAVCFMARDESVTWKTEEISTATQIPSAYVRKILQSLHRSEIISLHRGGGGGVRLARPRSEIRVFDVVDGVDPLQRFHACPLGLVEHGIELCPMHSVLDEALARLEEVMRETTIEDLLDPQARKRRRCQFPMKHDH